MNQIVNLDRRFSVAPMMDWTDRHFRYLARLLSKRALLYTEMVTTGAILHGDQSRFLNFNQQEHPLAMQLGGSDPKELAQCAEICESWGYDEINLNAGCPSDRVQNNLMGACLMAEKNRVAECLTAMKSSVSIPVTIKHRLGIDDFDSEAFLFDFVGHLLEAGITTFIVHARKAILKGLSPKQNREIPPLNYEKVYRLKEQFPQTAIIINGGVSGIEECKTHLHYVDGVMIGRAAYQRPALLMAVDCELFNDPASLPVELSNVSSHALIVGRQFLDYVNTHYHQGIPVWHMVRHSLGLFHGQPGGKAFRRYLSEHALKKSAKPDVFEKALGMVEQYQHIYQSPSPSLRVGF